MGYRRVSPSLSTQLSAGAGLLRTTPGLRVLLGGALATGVIVLMLHPHGLARLGLRAALAVPIILLFLALTGEVGRLRRDLRQMRALLGSATPWHRPLSRRRRLLMTCLCVALRAQRPQGVEPADRAEPPRREGQPRAPDVRWWHKSREHTDRGRVSGCGHRAASGALATQLPPGRGKGDGDEPRPR